jgi:hypothetical protein
MPETGTSGLMSGVGKRGGASTSVLAPNLDSTRTLRVALWQALQPQRKPTRARGGGKPRPKDLPWGADGQYRKNRKWSRIKEASNVGA